MGRPRKKPVEESQEAPVQSSGEWGGQNVTIKYVGPNRQECLPVAAITGVRFMETGKSYEVPSSLAKALMAGSSFWQKEE